MGQSVYLAAPTVLESLPLLVMRLDQKAAQVHGSKVAEATEYASLEHLTLQFLLVTQTGR